MIVRFIRAPLTPFEVEEDAWKKEWLGLEIGASIRPPVGYLGPGPVRVWNDEEKRWTHAAKADVPFRFRSNWEECIWIPKLSFMYVSQYPNPGRPLMQAWLADKELSEVDHFAVWKEYVEFLP